MTGHPFGRASRRYRIILPCEAKIQDHPMPQVISGWTCNLSAGGACLELAFEQTDGFALASLLSLTLELEEARLPLEGRVVWVGPPSPPVGTQHGVTFLGLTSEQRQRLHALTEQEGRVRAKPIPAWTGTFRLLFTGELKPGVHPEDAMERLARLLQLDDATLEGVLRAGGELWVIKQGLDQAMANRYVAALEAAGARCRVEAETRE